MITIDEVKTYQALAEENEKLKEQIASLERQNQFLRNSQKLTSELADFAKIAS